MAKSLTGLKTVQQPVVSCSEAVGWTVVPTDDAVTKRGGEGGLVFADVLRDQLIKLNADFMTPELADEVIARISIVRYSIEGNEEVLLWLRGKQSVYVPAEKRERDVVVIDFDDIDANVFHVTEEWTYTDGTVRNRADVVFLVNGMPVVVLEAKAAHRPDGI